MATPEGKAGCYATGAVILIFTGVIMLWTCFYKVQPNTIGVRTLMNGGIEQKDYPPGYVLRIPYLHKVRSWDPTWSNVYHHMDVRGSDGYRTSVDISVIFRIQENKCHEVARTFEKYADIESRVRTSLSQYASEILTQMKTEDFYNSKLRDLKTEEVQKKMDEQLEPQGLQVKSVLLRNIVYDEGFEKQLQAKQIAGLTLGLEDAKAKQAEGEGATVLITNNAEAEVNNIKETLTQDKANLTAETDQKINMITQNANVRAAEIMNEASTKKRMKMAEAERLRNEATAYGTAALSKVYARPGASYYFAQKSLQGLKLGNIEVNSSTFNPLEADRLLRALGLELRAPAPSTTPTGPTQQK